MITLDPRTRLEVLTPEACVRLLSLHHLGRLGVIADGRPLVLPVNYAFDGDSVVFRTDDGTKLHAAIGNPVIVKVFVAELQVSLLAGQQGERGAAA